MQPYSLPWGIVGITFIGAAGGAILLTKDKIGGGFCESQENPVGKTVIITGGNSGIGKETARLLAWRGAKVILACRDMKKCEETRKELMEDSLNNLISCKKIDLSSMSSVREFAEDINKNEKFVDILVNNAGVMRCENKKTVDGFEMQLGVNYLGHFLLTNLLLDKIKASAPSRIINVSCLSHKSGKINFDDLNSENNTDPDAAYKQSKLANVLFTKELARKLAGTGVTVNTVDPGLTRTELGRYMSMNKSFISSNLLSPLTYMIMRKPRQGAQTSLYCCVAKELENVTGKYFSGCKESEPSETADDEQVAKRLWITSEKWTRIA